MKVAVLMLSYERHDTLKQVLEHNLNNAGHPFDLFVWDNGSKSQEVLDLLMNSAAELVIFSNDNDGIAKPLNNLMRRAFNAGYDAIHVMANDILEPDDWLKDKVHYISKIDNSGMISISPGPIPYGVEHSAAGPVYPGDVIGQFMISRRVYKKVGRFNESFGHYGPIDNDYNARCAAMGFINYYIPGQSIHLHDPSGENYGYDKRALVAKTWPVHMSNVKRYKEDPSSAYIPVDGECTINMKQFFE